MTSERTFVSVSRKWANHTVNHTVIFDNDEVRIETDLNEFMIALSKEIGANIKLGLFTRTVPQDVLQAKLLECMQVVVADMKEQTKY